MQPLRRYPGARHIGEERSPARLLLHTLVVVVIGVLAALPAAGLAKEPDTDFVQSVCRTNQHQDFRGDPCLRPSRHPVLDAKVAAANAYHRFLTGEGSREEVERADYTVARLSGEEISAHALAGPQNTPAAKKLNGERVEPNEGSLEKRFWPFEQINWWYCGPATAQSILWYLGPHQSATPEPWWNGRPALTGNPHFDQPLLANGFWLATDVYGGTNWGERYMPFTLNSWRGSEWYVQSASPFLEGGDLSKEQALMYMRYDFDRSYPVAENVLYAPWTYYPAGFWPGIVYMHWDVVYGYVEEDGVPYVKIGQVYHDETLFYERFQQVAWDVHWTAIGEWHGIVW